MRILSFLFVNLLAFSAFGAEIIKYASTGPTTKLSAVLLSASAGSRTWSYTSNTNEGFGLIVAQITYTPGGATTVSAVTMSCTGNIDGTTSATLQSCSTSAGNCTSTDQIWTKAVSATKSWIWRVNAQGATNVSCVMGMTGTPDTDTFTVKTKITAF